MLQVLENILKRTLAENVAKLRKRLDLSQGDLAENTDLSLKMIQKIEYQEVWPSSDVIEKVAEKLGVNAWDLMWPSWAISGQQTKAQMHMADTIKDLTEQLDKVKSHPLYAYLENSTPEQIAFVKSYLDGSAVDHARAKLSQLEKSRKS